MIQICGPQVLSNNYSSISWIRRFLHVADGQFWETSQSYFRAIIMIPLGWNFNEYRVYNDEWPVGLGFGTWDILRGFPVAHRGANWLQYEKSVSRWANKWTIRRYLACPNGGRDHFTKNKVTVEKPRQRLQGETRAVCVSVFLEDVGRLGLTDRLDLSTTVKHN